MYRLTPDQMAMKVENLDDIEAVRMIEMLFHDQDESDLWPIKGEFDVTEKAIMMAVEFEYGSPLEYAYLVDGIISQIVNQHNA